MKRLMSLCFGNLGLAIASALGAVASFMLFDVFLQWISGNIVYKILGWSLAFPFTIGFILSAMFGSISLIIKSSSIGNKAKKWIYISVGIIILAFLIFVLLYYLI